MRSALCLHRDVLGARVRQASTYRRTVNLLRARRKELRPSAGHGEAPEAVAAAGPSPLIRLPRTLQLGTLFHLEDDPSWASPHFFSPPHFLLFLLQKISEGLCLPLLALPKDPGVPLEGPLPATSQLWGRGGPAEVWRLACRGCARGKRRLGAPWGVRDPHTLQEPSSLASNLSTPLSCSGAARGQHFQPSVLPLPEHSSSPQAGEGRLHPSSPWPVTPCLYNGSLPQFPPW